MDGIIWLYLWTKTYSCAILPLIFFYLTMSYFVENPIYNNASYTRSAAHLTVVLRRLYFQLFFYDALQPVLVCLIVWWCEAIIMYNKISKKVVRLMFFRAAYQLLATRWREAIIMYNKSAFMPYTLRQFRSDESNKDEQGADYVS